MNRRKFIKNVGYLLSGALASISGFVSAALPMTSVPKSKGLSAQDICNEALEKIGGWKPQDGWQLDNGKWQHIVIGDNGNDKPIGVYLNGKRID